MTNEQLTYYEKRRAKENLMTFVRWMRPDYDATPIHSAIMKLLDMFAHQRIRKMIIQMSPQCGKSELSSRMLPAFMLGLNPDLKIGLGSYAATIARDFNRDVQRIIDTDEYKAIFPDTFLNSPTS